MSEKASAVEHLKEPFWRSGWKDWAILLFFCVARERPDSRAEVDNP